MKTKDFLMRLTVEQHTRIKAAAEAKGTTMADWLRSHAMAAAAEVLDCTHPEEFRKIYPWSTTCLKCGVRL